MLDTKILKASLKEMEPRQQMHVELARAALAQNVPGVGEATALVTVYQLGRFLSVHMRQYEARAALAKRHNGGPYAP